MFNKLKDWYKRRTCRHSFVQVDSWIEKTPEITYPVKAYECLVCGVRVVSGKPFSR